MLPISLTLRNFLSYRDAAPTLHLEDVHVACLCGRNGDGKSALLDAVTWALWGKARGTREQLLHEGQDDMFVELVFDVAGERYRVTRRFSTARRNAQSSLELAVRSGPDSFSAITGNRIAETQAHIERLISMDYDTFVNSAFLVQGRADRFSTATPAARKEVLAKVLGLGLYDRLEERAKQYSRDMQGKLSAASALLQRLRGEAARAPAARAEVADAERSLAAANAVAGGLAERLERLREKIAHLERRKAEGAALEERRERAIKQRTQAESEASDLDRRVAEGRRIVERAGEIEAGFTALLQARERQREFAVAAQQVIALREKLAPCDQAIAAARAGLQRDAKAQRERIDSELKPRAESLPSIVARLDQVEQSRTALEERAGEASRMDTERQELASEARLLQEDNLRIEAEGKEKREKDAMLAHSHPDGARCPLCNSDLGPSGVASIRASYAQDIAQLRARYASQRARAAGLEQQAEGVAQAAAKEWSAVEQERSRLDEERARLEMQQDEAERAAREIESATAQLGEFETRIANGDYAQGEQAEARNLRSHIDALAYDAGRAGETEQEILSLSHWDAERQELVTAQSRLGDDQAALDRARNRSAEAAQETERAEQALIAITQEIRELPAYLAQHDERAQELEAATRDRDALQRQWGRLQQELENAERAAIEAAAVEREEKAAADEASAYGELALAFGKGGVQALLIEAAIPRLEDEANNLLGRMTDGRMSLKLQTQRVRKTSPMASGAIETLDVLIADELGTRPYELFSGGERFRVDFALRIALSRLLAWRAGAPLPTLFIDEGFGTQDVEGRDRILDVIKGIEDQFERILVITHMDDIKEAFPVRIEVSRGPSGSTFAIT